MISATVVLPSGERNHAGVADLAAGVAVEAGVIEHNVDHIASSGGGNAHAIFHDGQHFGIVGGELLVAEKLRFLEVSKCGAGGFLAAAFPTGAGAGLLFGAGTLEPFHVEGNAGVACRIDHEVQRQAKGLVEVECLVACEIAFQLFVQASHADLQHPIKLFLFCFHNFGHAVG